jgi:mono/diheme cytochrome c family protein
MKRYAFAVLTVLIAGGAQADAGHGKQLLAEHCTKCHDDSVYTRKDRFITSKEALAKHVNRCALNTGAQLFDEDIADITEYLNATYYKYK